MNLTIKVNDVTMQVEGEAFELALFARSVGKAVVTTEDASTVSQLERKPKAAKAPKPKRAGIKRSMTCKTCGGKGHIAKTCPSNK